MGQLFAARRFVIGLDECAESFGPRDPPRLVGATLLRGCDPFCRNHDPRLIGHGFRTGNETAEGAAQGSESRRVLWQPAVRNGSLKRAGWG